MCFGCWEEAGSPRTLSDKAKLLARYLPLVRPAGPLHIVTEDWNLEDEHLALCEDELLTELDKPPGYERALAQLERTVLLMLADMPIEERFAAMAAADGYVTFDGDLTPVSRMALAEPDGATSHVKH